MKKKIVTLCLVVALVLTAVIGGTMAYFTATDSAENEFTIGNVKIDLTEDAWDNGGKEQAKEAYPGEALPKDPTVKNIGENPCFIRVSVSNLEQFGNKGMIQLRTNYVLDALGENWVKYGDYYYYTKVVAAGEKTTALFDHIVMPSGLVGDEETKSIDVIAQAVQAQGAKPSFSALESITVEELAAWFTTCGF